MSQDKKTPSIDYKKCVLCLSCIDVCIYNAVRLVDEQIIINSENCVSCFDCINACPADALSED